MTKIPIELSIIIPVLNEGTLLKKIVEKTIKEAKAIIENKFEILIVNDGSDDKTSLIANQLAKKYKQVILINHSCRSGFGSSITSGIKKARFEFITFIPSDGQVYLRDLKMALIKSKDYDLVVTYRTNKSDYSLFRIILSLGFKILMRIFFGLSLKDYNWAQVYRKNIFSKFTPKSKGVFFLGETIVLAQQMNLKIGKSRIIYRPRISGKSKNANFRVVLETFIDLFKVWINTRSII